MSTIPTRTNYQSRDDVWWNTEEAAVKRNEVLDAIESAKTWLATPRTPDEEWTQNSAGAVKMFLAKAAEAIELEVGGQLADKFRANPRGVVGRVLDDSNCATYKLIEIVQRLDDQGREWHQRGEL